MKSPESPNFHTVEQKKEPESAPEFSFRNLWKRFAEFFRLKKTSGQEALRELEERKDDPEQKKLLTEAEKVAELYDTVMDSVENEAKLEIASLTGDANEVVEQIPKSELKRFVWYNLSTTPEGFMKEGERTKHERLVNLEHIEQTKKDWQE